MSFPWTVDDPSVSADSGNFTASGTFSPQFPNVPNLPGVPQVARMAALVGVGGSGGLGTVGETESLASALGLSGVVAFGNRLYSTLTLDSLIAGPLPKYTLFYEADQTVQVLIPSSVIDFEIRADSGIMTHPVEKGQFSAYNRVQEPISIRMLMAFQYSQNIRADELKVLRDLREGTALVIIATPDATYRNMALQNYGYRKSAERGAVTIWADTEWLESRSTGVTVSAPATAKPQGAATSNLGALQPQTPTSAQGAAIAYPLTAPAPLPARLSAEMPASGGAS